MHAFEQLTQLTDTQTLLNHVENVSVEELHKFHTELHTYPTYEETQAHRDFITALFADKALNDKFADRIAFDDEVYAIALASVEAHLQEQDANDANAIANVLRGIIAELNTRSA